MNTKTPLHIKKEYPFSKVGIDEVLGLKEAMRELMEPVKEYIKSQAYWSDVDLRESEYKSRDGFIPYSHNCGGIEISEVIPSIEQDTFDFLEYGECEECKPGEGNQCGYQGQECASESEGHLDAKLRVWFKFEGVSEAGVMDFYLYMGGGNADAPYFRTEYEATIFEASFQCASLASLRTKGKKHIAKLLQKLGAKC